MRLRRIVIGLGLILLFGQVRVPAQTGIGLPFLKIGTGARQAGLGDVFTGIGDDVHTMFYNPGGLGMIRRWQWAVSYSRWFSDVDLASVAFVQQFRIWGSRKTSLGFWATHLGIPSWDATGGLEPSVTVSHWVAGASFGQRLDWLSHSIGLGFNVKMISSRYDTYSANGVATDLGIMFSPGRFRLGGFGMGIFDYGQFSWGFSALHLGPAMTFETEATELPRTLRGGMAFRAGRYRGWNVLLASDWVSVKSREWTLGIGGELWWKDILGLRFGVRINREDLGDFTFGVGFRWDDVMNSLFSLPTRYGDAFEINLADAGYGDVLQQTYRGSLSHYPVAPEPFLLSEPSVVTSQVMGESSVVSLNWEKAADPDLFDEVRYLVFIDKNALRLKDAVQWAERDMRGFMASALRDSMLICESVVVPSFITPVNEGGIYYWAVAAYDLAGHARLAKRGKEQVAEFVVTTYDLEVLAFQFTPTEWITTTPEQGTFRFDVTNRGNTTSDPYRFVVQDLVIRRGFSNDTVWTTVAQMNCGGLDAGEDTTIVMAWSSENPGPHLIVARAEPQSWILDFRKENNIRNDGVFSVPKGRLLVPDSVEVMATGYDVTDVPFVPEVYFAVNSDMIDSTFIQDNPVSASVLHALARRMLERPDVVLEVMGSIDAMSGETDTDLADRRVEAVRRTLESFGVPSSRLVAISRHSGKILGRRTPPVNPQDAQWVMEQNRVVNFQVPQKDEEHIFKPFQVSIDTTLRTGILFRPRVVSPAKTTLAEIVAESGSIRMPVTNLAQRDSLRGDYIWDGTDTTRTLVPRNHWYRYHLTLVDSLGRTFRTFTDSIYVKEKKTIRRREVFGAAKFAQIEPVYRFYWDRLMDVARELMENLNMRIRFEGHACAIGPDAVNDRLSLQRAQRFTAAFMERLKAAYPTQAADVVTRIDTSVGFGESDPFVLKVKNMGDVLLGDNNTPAGRYLNRRIMVLLYTENR